MKIGVIGLGRMGAAIVHRLLDGGHEVVAFDQDGAARSKVKAMGASIALDATHLARESRVIWLMVPAGKVVDKVIEELRPELQEGDIVIDGGNSNFKDTIRRAKDLAKNKVQFIDCGTSGGLKGEDIGFSLMIGGDVEAYTKIEPIFKAIATDDGYGHMGPSGAGHYVKMIHNGIEYALLQSYAEGFHLLKEGRYTDLDLTQVAKVWENGSIIRSFIVELCQEIFSEDQNLEEVPGAIGENLTGYWTAEEAREQNVPVKLIDDALIIRKWSRETGGNYGTKVVAMLRHKFGGHPLKKHPLEKHPLEKKEE